MLNILVVDDEVLERKALTKIINSSKEGVTVIGEARNGRKAIEMAKTLRPDLIFMDIKMPGIDGVEAVKEIRKFAPDIRFIMVSAFNTFEYAKEVMQQGVKEYILKPSRTEDILASLNRVVDEIRSERRHKIEQQSLMENLNRAVSIAQKEWVSSMILNQIQDISFDEWGELLGIEITSGYVMLFLIEPKEGTEVSLAEKQNWYSWLKGHLKSAREKEEIMIGPMTENQVPVLILCKNTTEKYQHKLNAQSIIDQIFNQFIKGPFRAELKIGVGLLYKHAYELNQSYHDAVMAIGQLQNSPQRKYIISNKRDNKEIPIISEFLEIEKKLLDSLRQGDVNQVLRLFDTLVTKQAEKEKWKTPVFIKAFDELFILISRMLHDLGINYQQSPTFDATENQKKTVEKAKSHLLAVVNHVQAWRNNHAKGMLQKAKEFIESHYSDSITLEQVAEYVELSPFYFSKLFKDRFGMTFIDYLTEIRINRAKTEMENPGKSLKEICYSVGYRDPNYFSRVFKKQTGLSPSEYRKAIVS
ncbi:response regulator [Bacillus sp. JJ1764]|uniref:response regulator n=1 Tax=Bacillus sp. JJ1764 TaxID=3122964 RepID=UPI002FFDF7A7